MNSFIIRVIWTGDTSVVEVLVFDLGDQKPGDRPVAKWLKKEISEWDRSAFSRRFPLAPSRDCEVVVRGRAGDWPAHWETGSLNLAVSRDMVAFVDGWDARETPITIEEEAS